MHTSFLSLATQTQLARYQEATGCEFEVKTTINDPSKPEAVWVEASVRNASVYFGHGFLLRLKLSDLNLPSHLPPHNPAKVPADVITAGGYRAWTVMEREKASTSKWNGGQCSGYYHGKFEEQTPSHGNSLFQSYRVPISVPFPDWHLAGEAEGHPVETRPATYETGREDGRAEMHEAFDAASHPTFSIPQPITDPMPPLAEGCQRYYTSWHSGVWISLGSELLDDDTHFFDLQDLPVPVDTNRAAFEAAMAETGFQDFRRKHDDYVAVYASAAWKGWNLHNA